MHLCLSVEFPNQYYGAIILSVIKSREPEFCYTQKRFPYRKTSILVIHRRNMPLFCRDIAATFSMYCDVLVLQFCSNGSSVNTVLGQ